MKNQSIFKIVLLFCLILFSQLGSSVELIFDNFSYSTGPLANNSGWNSFILQTGSEKSAAIDEVNVVESPLIYDGYLSSNKGKSIQLDGLNKDVYRLFPYVEGITTNNLVTVSGTGRIISGSVYASMLINVERPFYGAGDVPDTKGDCFFAFGANNWGIGAAGRIYTRKLNEGYQIGVTRAGNAKTVWDATERKLNTTYLIVIKYTINPSPNSEKNDRVYLSVNPVLGPTEPVWIENDVTDANAELANILGSVQFIQKINTSANNPLTVTTKMKVGGLRVATSWAEVGELDSTNGIDENFSNRMKIRSENGKLVISGISAGEILEVYNCFGQRITSLKAVDGDNELRLKNKGLLIFKAGNLTGKLVL